MKIERTRFIQPAAAAVRRCVFTAAARDHVRSSQPATRGTTAFTLVELIGVLAIITILAAMAAPVVIRHIDEAARTREIADLKAIADGLTFQILATKSIPREADLPAAVAAWTRQPINRITQTPRRYDRRFLVDPAGWPWNVTSVGWSQTWIGVTNQLNRSRIVIVSSTSRNLPALTGSDFVELWNTPAGQKPASWSSWQGTGEDLHIERVNLEPLFYHLVLVNRDPIGNAWFSVDNAIRANFSTVRRAYYLDGTDLGLFTATNQLQSRVILDRDQSFLFQGGLWANYLDSGDDYSEVTGNEFANLVGVFMGNERVDTAHKGGNQQGAVICMFNFMLTYQLWANQCPQHFPTYGLNRNKVPEYILMLNVAGDLSSSSLLNSFTGSDGLLK
jgi:type II secretory pathway pseudopilin PulG